MGTFSLSSFMAKRTKEGEREREKERKRDELRLVKAAPGSVSPHEIA